MVITYGIKRYNVDDKLCDMYKKITGIPLSSGDILSYIQNYLLQNPEWLEKELTEEYINIITRKSVKQDIISLYGEEIWDKYNTVKITHNNIIYKFDMKTCQAFKDLFGTELNINDIKRYLKLKTKQDPESELRRLTPENIASIITEQIKSEILDLYGEAMIHKYFN